MSFNSSTWLKARRGLTHDKFEFNVSGESYSFALISLTKDMVDELKDVEVYEDVLSKAADYGLSVDRLRAFDLVSVVDELEVMWALDEMQVDVDPCIKYRVGERVCEISGLQDHLEYLLEVKKEEDGTTTIDGDENTPDPKTTLLGDLEREANMAP